MCRARPEDDRTHLLFSLLNGLRLIIPQFTRDPASSDFPGRSALLPGVYYVFYKLPAASTAVKPARSTPQQLKAGVAARRPRPARRPQPQTKTAAAAAAVAVQEPLEGLYDRRQVKRKQEVMVDRRRTLDAQPRSAASQFPICYVGGVTYILNPNADIVIGLPRPEKNAAQ